MNNPFPDAPRVVHKYGGSSVVTPELICAVAKGVASRHALGQQIIVVVSAMGKTTNQLIELAGSVSSGPCSREMDMLRANRFRRRCWPWLWAIWAFRPCR